MIVVKPLLSMELFQKQNINDIQKTIYFMKKKLDLSIKNCIQKKNSLYVASHPLITSVVYLGDLCYKN